LSLFANDLTPGEKGYAKLGSIDEKAYIGELHMIRTVSKDTWKLNGYNFMFDDKKVSGINKRKVLLDPGVSQIYIPDADWRVYAEYVANKYSDVICQFETGICKVT